MSASNNRVKAYGTVHHLMSRVAHKVFILGDEDRNELIDIIRRTADFVGIQLLGWCLMTNHFHLLAYLPEPAELDEEEVLRRYGVLKGAKAAETMAAEFQRLRQKGLDSEIDVWLRKQRQRMYDIGSFMKTVKQWFTEEYNRRHHHTGTLWESVYIDKKVKRTFAEMSRRLGYINLNPINAAMTDRYDGYAWSSFAAFKRGDQIAVAGMKFIYGEVCENRSDLFSQMVALHVSLLDDQLSDIKRNRAAKIARLRAVGADAPCDPLTNEALVQQELAHLEEVRRAYVSFKEGGEYGADLFSDIESKVWSLLYLDPSLDTDEVANRLQVSPSTVYRAIETMKGNGTLVKLKPDGAWIVGMRKQV